MTKATTEGRRLMLTVDGIDEPFLVDPLPAKRGRYLTDRFIRASLREVEGALAEQIFIEAIGPANYSRLAGQYVDEFEEATGEYLRTWGPAGIAPQLLDADSAPSGTKFIARDEYLGEEALDGEPIRQEEAEALALCAFYWQTVVGIEAVNMFIEGGEGSTASLKAMGLLQIRLGLSPSPNSSPEALESSIREMGRSSATPNTPTLSASVRLPANKQSIGQNPAKRSKRK